MTSQGRSTADVGVQEFLNFAQNPYARGSEPQIVVVAGEVYEFNALACFAQRIALFLALLDRDGGVVRFMQQKDWLSHLIGMQRRRCRFESGGVVCGIANPRRPI